VDSRSNPIYIGIVALCSLLAGAGARATTYPHESNIVELVQQSELILRGTVSNVTDGIDEHGVPYTEVTLHVAEAIRGQVGDTYTFRQFGLLKPRSVGNGLVNVMVTPAGWPIYHKGEDNILFLNKHAKWTGLQTTVGLTHGQFRVSMGGAANMADNHGLFAHVTVDSNLLEESDRRVMNTEKGAVNAKAFVSLVRKMVDGRWVELGSMRNEQH
jgi:hypothetical protein